MAVRKIYNIIKIWEDYTREEIKNEDIDTNSILLMTETLRKLLKNQEEIIIAINETIEHFIFKDIHKKAT